MDVDKIIFLGNSHVQGVGSEWPKLHGDLVGTPKPFQRNVWTNYVKSTKETPEEVFKKFKEITSSINFDFNFHPKLKQYRDQYSWASVFASSFKKEYVNFAFPAYNLAQITAKLIVDSPTFDNSLTILGVPPLTNDIVFHHPRNGKQLMNMSIINAAQNIILIKEFVERRGGRFVYFHVEDYPFEFYDVKNNPMLYHLTDIRLFERSLYSLFTPNFHRKRHDGIHYNMEAQKFIGNKFIKEFKNTLIYSVLTD